MPNSASAKKSVRAADRKWVYNERRRRALKSAVKAVSTKVTEGDKKAAEAALPAAYKAIDKAAQRGVIKKNTAARKKSRLTKTVSGLK